MNSSPEGKKTNYMFETRIVNPETLKILFEENISKAEISLLIEFENRREDYRNLLGLQPIANWQEILECLTFRLVENNPEELEKLKAYQNEVITIIQTITPIYSRLKKQKHI